MGDILDGYVAADVFDGTVPRDHYRQLHAALETPSRTDFDQQCDARDQAFRDQGITFSLLGEERPFTVEFLLLDRLFPRSVFFALTTTERALGELDPRADRTGVNDEARRFVGQMCADLAFVRVDHVVARLAGYVTWLQDACEGVHGALATRYFRETSAIAWSS